MHVSLDVEIDKWIYFHNWRRVRAFYIILTLHVGGKRKINFEFSKLQIQKLLHEDACRPPDIFNNNASNPNLPNLVNSPLRREQGNKEVVQPHPAIWSIIRKKKLNEII